jgi:hypothetical protein
MRIILQVIAGITAFSVAATLWLVAAIAVAGGFPALLETGLLGGLTIVGWCMTLFAGPVLAVHLWRATEVGRRIGIVFYGYAVVYYGAGLLLRSAGASVGQIAAALVLCALPVLILLSPGTKAATAGRR